MTETAETVIKDALGLLQIRAEEEPLEQADAQVAIRTLNRMMARFQTKGISLGFTVITKISDPMTISDDALDGVTSNLAINLHPHFKSGEVTQTLASLANVGYDSLLDLCVDVGPSSYPDTLPVGSGNTNNFQSSDFYPGYDEEIGAEIPSTIGLESNTESEVS